MLSVCGSIVIDSRNRYGIKIHTENIAVARKVFTLIKKTFNIESDISVRRNILRQSVSYSIIVKQHQDALRILQATKRSIRTDLRRSIS
jgi:DNA-binding transcriptional regulator WhiA